MTNIKEFAKSGRLFEMFRNVARTEKRDVRMKAAPALERDHAVAAQAVHALQSSDPLPNVGDCLSRGSPSGGRQPQTNTTSLAVFTVLAVQLHEADRIAKPVKFWTSDAPSCC